MKISSEKIFLLDGLGAMLSAMIMGLIVAQFVSFFGLPKNAAYFLAAFPCVFLLYSFYIHFNLPDNWRPYLKMIIIANLLYCFVSIGVVFYFFNELSPFGLAYLLLEKLVVIIVILFELKALRK